MILTALVELAEFEGLVKNADYQPMPVRWEITIGADGRMKGSPRDTLPPQTDKKVKPTAVRYDIPKRSARTVNSYAEFVVDKPEYVFGWVSADDLSGLTAVKEAKLRKRAADRHELYKAELRVAADASGDEGLAALVRFFAGPPPELPAELGSGDLIGFEFDGTFVSSRPQVAAYWAVRRRQPECGSGRPGTESTVATDDGLPCLVTGVMAPPVELHPKPKGIPPASKTKGGVPLTSVNADAFDSYGLRGVGGAAVSQPAADAYEKALNRLLADGYPDPTTGAPMARRNVRLADDTVVVFWSKGDPNAVDLFADTVGQADPAAVEALFRASYKGKAVDLHDPTAFYALTLTGGQGRGTVRGWQEERLGDVLRNVRQYFADLTVARPPQDAGRPQPLIGFLRQLAARGEIDNIPSALAGDLFQAVLAGRPFPRGVLEALVRRVRAERTIFGDRAALLKAYLCRAGLLPVTRPRLDPHSPEEQFIVLNDDYPTPAYRLGRLFAVLEKLQDDAIGASAGIRDRYYGAASATPVVVFPQLLRKAPHHLSKLGGGQETYYEKLIQQVLGGLEAAVFPATLRLEEQGLFALGYYHQRQALFTKKADKSDPTTPDAPKGD